MGRERSGIQVVRRVVTRTRAAVRAGGAGESGLAGLIELHGIQAAGDALVAVSLANSLFFSVPVGEARGKVGLYLLITMLPFALLAPVVGPVLDRFRRGRRIAMATTLGARGVLAWVLASALAGDDPFRLYPAAFGVLVLARAYGITRSAAVPRLLPHGTGLVKANARVNLAAVVGAALAAPLGIAIIKVSSVAWSLRLAAVAFACAGVLALRQPSVVDSAAGEQPLASAARTGPRRAAPRRALGPEVTSALRQAAVLRAWTGYLTFFLAFLLQPHPFGGLPATAQVALVAVAGAVGGAAGTATGSRMRSVPAERIFGLVLTAAAATATFAALTPSLLSVMVMAAAAGAAGSLGKLALDSTIQERVPDEVRTSAFGRSETLLQLSWVLGAGLGTLLPLRAGLGLGVGAVGLAAALLATRLRPSG